MTENSQWVPSGPELGKKANVHRMLHMLLYNYPEKLDTGYKRKIIDQILLL